MLAAMFSGRFPIEKDEDDGAYFIDRDGRVFGHILTWLRIGELSPQLSKEDLFFLQKEAEYYQLEALKKLLQESTKTKENHCVLIPSYSEWKTMMEQQYHLAWAQYNQKKITKPQRVDDSYQGYVKDQILSYVQQGYKLITVPNLQSTDFRNILVLEPNT